MVLGRFLRFIIVRWCGDLEQLAGERDIVLVRATCEQAVMPDAVEAGWQDMEQEAADELVGAEGHDLLPVTATAAIILVAEGDVLTIEPDEAAVRDRNAVSVA